jgi:hypothetical protein
MMSSRVSQFFLAILPWLFSGIVTADDGLAKLSAASREAALVMSIDLSPTEQGHFEGAFISDDGLALVGMGAVCGPVKPRVTVAGGAPLKFGTVLGIFPEQDVALMKFAHRPKVWLRLAAKEPGAGESLALVVINPKHLTDDKVPSIVGSMMAKRSAPASYLRETALVKVLSLGAGVSAEQRHLLTNGSFSINAKGELVAFFFDFDPAKGQTFIDLAPVSSLVTRVDELAKGNTTIPFPVPKASNPRDQAAVDGDWRIMVTAILKKERRAARTAYQKLVKRYPDSYQLKIIYLNHDLLQEEDPFGESSKFSEPAAGASAAEKILLLTLQANTHLTKDDFEGAIPYLKKAVALCPKDFPKIRKGLADVYVKLGRLDEAEALYREAWAYWPESIETAEALAHLLDERGKYDEAIKLTDRAVELERIYRRP